MIREQEEEILPDLVEELVQKKVPPPIFSKCPASSDVLSS